MRLPDFLVIGAMKSGTTSIYRELYKHPHIFLPEEKEPNFFISPESETPEGIRAYASLFSAARPEAIVGEASTSYTMYPRYGDVAGRVYRVLGPKVKLIYIVREPLSRTRSHLEHAARTGRIRKSFASDLAAVPHYIDISRYYMQITQWLRHFERQQLLIIDLEDYRKNNQMVMRRTLEFLGLDVVGQSGSPAVAEVHNSKDSARVLPGMLRKFVDSNAYRRIIKPIVQWHLRDFLQRQFVLPPQKVSDSWNAELESVVSSQLAPDMAAFKNYCKENGISASWLKD
jgi:hypothetical protein